MYVNFRMSNAASEQVHQRSLNAYLSGLLTWRSLFWLFITQRILMETFFTYQESRRIVLCDLDG